MEEKLRPPPSELPAQAPVPTHRYQPREVRRQGYRRRSRSPSRRVVVKLGSWFTCADGAPFRWGAVFMSEARRPYGTPERSPFARGGNHFRAHLFGHRTNAAGISTQLGGIPQEIGAAPARRLGRRRTAELVRNVRKRMPSHRRRRYQSVEKFTRTDERDSTCPVRPILTVCNGKITLCIGMDFGRRPRSPLPTTRSRPVHDLVRHPRRSPHPPPNSPDQGLDFRVEALPRAEAGDRPPLVTVSVHTAASAIDSPSLAPSASHCALCCCQCTTACASPDAKPSAAAWYRPPARR